MIFALSVKSGAGIADLKKKALKFWMGIIEDTLFNH